MEAHALLLTQAQRAEVGTQPVGHELLVHRRLLAVDPLEELEHALCDALRAHQSATQRNVSRLRGAGGTYSRCRRTS